MVIEKILEEQALRIDFQNANKQSMKTYHAVIIN